MPVNSSLSCPEKKGVICMALGSAYPGQCHCPSTIHRTDSKDPLMYFRYSDSNLVGGSSEDEACNCSSSCAQTLHMQMSCSSTPNAEQWKRFNSLKHQWACDLSKRNRNSSVITMSTQILNTQNACGCIQKTGAPADEVCAEVLGIPTQVGLARPLLDPKSWRVARVMASTGTFLPAESCGCDTDVPLNLDINFILEYCGPSSQSQEVSLSDRLSAIEDNLSALSPVKTDLRNFMNRGKTPFYSENPKHETSFSSSSESSSGHSSDSRDSSEPIPNHSQMSITVHSVQDKSSPSSDGSRIDIDVMSEHPKLQGSEDHSSYSGNSKRSRTSHARGSDARSLKSHGNLSSYTRRSSDAKSNHTHRSSFEEPSHTHFASSDGGQSNHSDESHHSHTSSFEDSSHSHSETSDRKSSTYTDNTHRPSDAKSFRSRKSTIHDPSLSHFETSDRKSSTYTAHRPSDAKSFRSRKSTIHDPSHSHFETSDRKSSTYTAHRPSDAKSFHSRKSTFQDPSHSHFETSDRKSSIYTAHIPSDAKSFHSRKSTFQDPSHSYFDTSDRKSSTYTTHRSS